jgi:hypothetical protein
MMVRSCLSVCPSAFRCMETWTPEQDVVVAGQTLLLSMSWSVQLLSKGRINISHVSIKLLEESGGGGG